MLWVALAGPVTNLLLAIVSAVLLRVVAAAAAVLPYSQLLQAVILPFSGMIVASIWINLVLCIFNFLPIPPLDGSRILTGLLPEKMARTYVSYEKYGFVIILLLAFSGVLWTIISPIIKFANSLLLA